jgi:hypothetical protein
VEDTKSFWETQCKRDDEIHALRVKEFEDCKRLRKEQSAAQLRVEKNAAERHADWMRINTQFNEFAKQLSVKILSFRDECAIAAMECAGRFFGECPTSDGAGAKTLAERAFDIADAMEAERQKRSQK